jgi:hypothetical protein
MAYPPPNVKAPVFRKMKNKSRKDGSGMEKASLVLDVLDVLDILDGRKKRED